MKPKYIDANQIQWHSNWPISNDARVYAYMDEVDNIPAADVKEVRHGYWVKQQVSQELCGVEYYCCSLCNHEEQYKPPYCPFCGAKMDGKEK